MKSLGHLRRLSESHQMPAPRESWGQERWEGQLGVLVLKPQLISGSSFSVNYMVLYKIWNALVEGWKPCWYSHSHSIETKNFKSLLKNLCCAATWAYVQLPCLERTFERTSETLITYSLSWRGVTNRERWTRFRICPPSFSLSLPVPPGGFKSPFSAHHCFRWAWPAG